MNYMSKNIVLQRVKIDYLVSIYLAMFLAYQVSLILKGGTTWDDLLLLETTPRIIEKYRLFFADRSNPFLSEFSSNFEFYGFLILLPTYLFSNNLVVLKIFHFLFNDFMSLGIRNEEEIEYILRHIFLNIYLVLALFLVYKIYSKISDDKYSFLFILVLTFIPLVNGHALFNLKDIPFMVQNLLASSFFLYYLKNIKNNSYREDIKLGIFFGLLLLVRLNGFAFIFICFSFFFLYVNKNLESIKQFIFSWFRIMFTSLIVLIIGTPSAWQKPRLWFEESINTQFNIYWDSYVLTNGNFSFAMDVNPFYLITWLNFKLPLIFHVSLFFTLFFIITEISNKSKRATTTLIYSAYFIAVVIAGFIYLRPVVYDGIRQYLFLVPFFVLLFVETLRVINLRQNVKIIFLLIIFTYLGYTQWGLGPYKYIYFNELADETNITLDCNEVGGCGDWQTDYWGYSGKELMKVLNYKEVSGEVYFCNPEHVFTTYFENNNLKIINNINSKNKEFYLVYIHRPMLKNDICGFNNLDIKVECENFIVEKTTLRSEDIFLSYVDKCKSV
tara:strand:+ start:14365 stop:16032 length:1668 start_codon:yes stop_codon:yes gene_type:complete